MARICSTFASALAGGTVILMLAGSVQAQGINADVGVSIGGGSGINADADASIGGGGGVDADADASIGGGGGVDAEASTSVTISISAAALALVTTRRVSAFLAPAATRPETRSARTSTIPRSCPTRSPISMKAS